MVDRDLEKLLRKADELAARSERLRAKTEKLMREYRKPSDENDRRRRAKTDSNKLLNSLKQSTGQLTVIVRHHYNRRSRELRRENSGALPEGYCGARIGRGIQGCSMAIEGGHPRTSDPDERTPISG
jgi:hypothetical protein